MSRDFSNPLFFGAYGDLADFVRHQETPSAFPKTATDFERVTAASLYSAAAVAGGGDGGNCKRYTEDICIAAADYPSEAILAVLNRNARVGNDLIADVVDQSADR